MILNFFASVVIVERRSGRVVTRDLRQIYPVMFDTENCILNETLKVIC